MKATIGTGKIVQITSPFNGLSKTYLLATFLERCLDKTVQKLRRFFYKSVLARLGNNVRIHSHVRLINPGNIEIGNDIKLKNNVTLEALSNSKIVLADQVILADGAYLKAGGGNNKICLKEKTHLDNGVYLRAIKGGSIEIDEGTYIGPYSCFAGPGLIKIGKNCLISSHNEIYANSHNFRDPRRKINEQGLTCKGITIKDDCWLGSGVKILDGVTIGEGSVIGAGAVVTKSIPPYSVAVGVPAKVVSQRDKA